MEKIVTDFLEEIGYKDAYDEEQEKRVQNWLKWYKGKTKEHEYYVYNGQKRTKKTLKSLNIIPQSCNDLADFFFNEKLEITIDNKKSNDIIKEVLKANDFLFNANNLMQLTKALGTGAIIPYLEKNVLKINYIDATGIIILEADKHNVKSVLFWNKTNNKLTINAHILKEEEYVIYNRVYQKKGEDYVKQNLGKELEELHTHSTLPKFSLIFPPDVNNKDINSPYGISCFENAKDTVISIDSAYDSLDNEITAGRKRIYVKGGAIKFNTDSEGNMTPVFDTTDTTYYQLPGEEKDPMVTSDNTELRIAAITDALQSQINLYTSKVGLGHEYYKFKDGQAYVNTDNIISSNSDVYRKIKKQENIITIAITDLCYAIAELLGLKQKFSVSVDYDDTIIEDTESIRKSSQIEYNSKIISKAQYFRNVYNMDEKNAIKFVTKMSDEIKAEQKELNLSNEEEPEEE